MSGNIDYSLGRISIDARPGGAYNM